MALFRSNAGRAAGLCRALALFRRKSNPVPETDGAMGLFRRTPGGRFCGTGGRRNPCGALPGKRSQISRNGFRRKRIQT